MKYYCLFDVVVGEYGQLFTAINDSDCIRKLAYSQRENPFTGDLKLFYVGEFDVESGKFVCGLKFVANMVDVMSTGANVELT